MCMHARSFQVVHLSLFIYTLHICAYCSIKGTLENSVDLELAPQKHSVCLGSTLLLKQAHRNMLKIKLIKRNTSLMKHYGTIFIKRKKSTSLRMATKVLHTVILWRNLPLPRNKWRRCPRERSNIQLHKLLWETGPRGSRLWALAG